MSRTSMMRRFFFARLRGVCFHVAGIGQSRGSQPSGHLHPVAEGNQLESKAGADQAVLYGDPAKPGLYVILIKWHPHHMSRPHFHPNDRIATVLSGTWWVGTGPKYQPDSTVGVPPGSVVKHFAKQIHYDSTSDEDTTIEIVGMGPETATPAEEK